MSEESQHLPEDAPEFSAPSASGPAAPPAPEPPAVQGDQLSGASKLLAGFGYLVGIVALIAILVEPYKSEPFVRHHAVQALGLWVVSIILGAISGIPVVGWILGFVGGIAVVVFAIIGCIHAFQGRYYELPLIYGVVKQYI